MARLLALESYLLSDRGLLFKQWTSWLVLLGLVGYCGLGSEWNLSRGHFDYLQDPSRFDGSPITLSYVPVVPYTDGPGYLLRTYFGFVPLRNPQVESTGGAVSIRALWHADGTMTVLEQWAHPLRSLKTQLSAFAGLALSLALLYQYRLRRPA